MRTASLMYGVGCLLVAVGLGGCGFIPMSGPSSLEIRTETSPTLPYALVRLDAHAVQVLESHEPNVLGGVFTDRRPPSGIKFGVGDVVNVTIFEAAAGGLFIPIEAGVRPGNYVTLPSQTVDNDGNITVPYAGVIRAAGRTNVQVQNEIVERIRNRAIEPQVVVSLSEQRTSLVSVVGDVRSPTRYPMPATGALDRITDALTRAGGISGNGWETWVLLERDGKRATVPFANLVYMPVNNIYVQPGDRIYVYREPMKFLAFGATGQQGEFNFDAWKINLAQAVAKAGGLFDTQADPGSIFLYRREPRDVAEKLGVDCSKFSGGLIPIVFTVSFQDPAGYFHATKVQMRPFDIVYVANSAQVDATKFLNFLNTAIGTSDNGVNLINDIYIARYNSRIHSGATVATTSAR
ncbi:polysaccharide export protein [Rhodoplanes sp. TEM]|uniref:Polysaccharide export protein n=1 Tax=Rhodoplanes tepidamans TaxID=200616 RepID=A0ABT5JAP9_RHOTP|nr:MULTISPECIES: polysaccharide biosynthesis/export family protein [Rhodoplanes]MDC7786722.1 polysaccharide export protein [Rhodoplanes tepidamans]MDC7983728.1 polysaccharide export protein [Rhodoplanes sp. TEM]MDQ0358158.1 polysaccharide export outer membrane protein [Rhodoplanes tepidamans]